RGRDQGLRLGQRQAKLRAVIADAAKLLARLVGEAVVVVDAVVDVGPGFIEAGRVATSEAGERQREDPYGRGRGRDGFLEDHGADDSKLRTCRVVSWLAFSRLRQSAARTAPGGGWPQSGAPAIADFRAEASTDSFGRCSHCSD